MKLTNKAMLITYADSLGNDLKELNTLLDSHFEGVIGGIHLLPFYPSSGDRGFAPLDYQQVDPNLGSWQEVEQLSHRYYLMVDFMINHISRQSTYFQDFLATKENSPFKDMFIRYATFWENGEPTEEQVDLIYKRKPRAPFVEVTFADGSQEKVWCTFDEQQIDLDVTTDVTRQFIKKTLSFLAEKGASVIRLDAFAYANKKADTNCFFVEPDIWEMLNYSKEIIAPYEALVLPEIHEHYTIQQKIAEEDYYVYDFALPMLVLYTLYSGKANRLVEWLTVCPRKQFTTLDTHDGIGVVDAKDLLSDSELEMTREALYAQGANVKKIYSSEAYNNLDIYQINCTYYSALGNRDADYILARVLQVFAPGIPQIYYVGLLAGENDIELLEKTKEGRNINRHYYTVEEVESAIERPVVKQLFNLLKFRNSAKAFDGEFSVEQLGENKLQIIWDNQEINEQATLIADVRQKTYEIRYFTEGRSTVIQLGE